MSGERPTLADELETALAGDEALLEQCAQADASSWGASGTWELLGNVLRSEHRAAACAVLAVIAEAVREG